MIVIYTKAVTHRLRYTFDTVFRDYFGVHYQLVTNPEDAPDDGFRINYSGTPLAGWYTVHREDLLFETGIRPQRPFISRLADMPVIFEGTEAADLGFDIFAAAFYLLSRYEEYLPHEQDVHGRYRPTNSILSNPAFDFAPIVETWLIYLRQQLRERAPNIAFTAHQASVAFTFDIDQAFAYKGRRWPKILGSLTKSAGRRTLFHGEPDPFDTLPEIFRFLKDRQASARFFFLLNDRGSHNSSVNPHSALLKAYIEDCARDFEIGIHPSYHAQAEGLLDAERSLLETFSGIPVPHSRQHFLRLSFPGYFRYVAAWGIQHDHSLGYPEVSGFRAGFSRPFRFFDVEMDRETGLYLHPFAFMDATYIYYKQAETSQIIKKILGISEQVSKVSGKLVTVSHNDLLGKYCPVDFWEVLKNCAV